MNNLDVNILKSHSCGYVLWRTGAKWKRLVSIALGKHKITVSQFYILNSVDELNGNAILTDIAKHSNLDMMVVSKLSRNLSEIGLLTRVRNKADDRSKLVMITDEGKRVLEEARASIEEVEINFLASLKQNEEDAMKEYAINILT